MADDRYIYDVESLRRALGEFEHAYGLSSEEFYEIHISGGELPPELPRFDRHVWASFVEDVHRLEGSAPPIERVTRSFAHA
jgi:hypothetical protein